MRCMSVLRIHLYCKIWMQQKLERNANNATGERILQNKREREKRKESDDVDSEKECRNTSVNKVVG